MTPVQSHVLHLNCLFTVIFSFPWSVVGLYSFISFFETTSHVAHADLELTIWLRVALNFVGSGITSVQQTQVLSLLSEGSTGTQAAFPWASELLLVTIHTKDPFQLVSTPATL